MARRRRDLRPAQDSVAEAAGRDRRRRMSRAQRVVLEAGVWNTDAHEKRLSRAYKTGGDTLAAYEQTIREHGLDERYAELLEQGGPRG